MKFTYNWLKEYVDIKLKPEVLAEKITMAGLEIEVVTKVEDDWVFEAEVTTNRPDWLSIIGIAREVAAITGKSVRPRRVGSTAPHQRGEQHTRRWPQVDIQVFDALACPRYTGRIISDVKAGPSPDWLKKRLQSIGVRTVNNVVDITNFVLFETGQPLHAFDFDKLSGAKIIVRRAKDSEEIVTIDGLKRKLNSGMLVIADERSPVAIAGVMGGENTEVTENTKTILLESAYFDPQIVRKCSRALGLSSDSSYRFERNVDLAAVKTASDRAVELIVKYCNAKTAGLVDVGKKTCVLKKVSLRLDRLNALAGVVIPGKDVLRILNALGLKSVRKGVTKFVFSVPSWRQDIKNEVDLIEEVVRIYGYNNIPDALPQGIDKKEIVFAPKQFEFENLIRNTLVSFGLNEVLTYGLVDKNIDGIFQPVEIGQNVVINNPLSPELAVLRRNLVAGVLLSARWNINRNAGQIKLFEIGPVYSIGALNRKEDSFLAICLSGLRADNWQDGAKQTDFYYLKGIIESLFLKIGIKDYEISSSDNKILLAAQSTQIKIAGETIGSLGKVKKELLSKIDIEKDCFVCQLDLEKLFKYARFEKRFVQLPKFPAVCRDISTLAKQEISNSEIVNVIKEAAGSILTDIKLFDVYRGEQIPKGHKSLVYRLTYQSPEKTLTDTEVEIIHSKIISNLKEKLGVGVR